jgi:ribosomal protein S4
MKKFTKHKYNKRLMNLVRFNRHKYVRKSLTSSKKKIIFFSGLNYNKIRRRSILKTDRLKFYEQNPTNISTTIINRRKNNDNASNLLVQNENTNETNVTTIVSNSQTKNTSASGTKRELSSLFVAIKKKKYKLNSYLFNVICKLPRKYIQNFVGKEILRKYYTMPLKLSMTRFTINKILRGYYKHLSYKALSNLSRNKSLSKIQKNLISNKQPIYNSKNKDIGKGKITSVYNLEKKEISKNFIENLEERLDSSILRLLNFKSLYTIKRSSYASRYKDNAMGKKKRFPRYTVKSPLTNYTALQIKQLINHGHISINNKKVTSGTYKIQLGHELKVNGFISKLPLMDKTLANHSTPSANSLNNLTDEFVPLPIAPFSHFHSHNPTHIDLKNNHKYTLLLRRLKNQDYIQNLGETLTNQSQREKQDQIPKEDIDINAESNLMSFVRNLRIKRFTEIFFMTYRNMHLLDRNFSGFATANESLNSQIHIEKHIKPIFDYMGHNQSMFMLWPVVSLLKIASFSSSANSSASVKTANVPSLGSIKKNIIQFSITSTKEDKQKLQNLLRYKRNLNRLENNYKISAQSQENSNKNNEEINIGTTSFAGAKEKNHKDMNSKSIPGKIMQIASVDKSKIFYARSSKCYASILYGTRVCK